jgi:hypothetical protein
LCSFVDFEVSGLSRRGLAPLRLKSEQASRKGFILEYGKGNSQSGDADAGDI